MTSSTSVPPIIQIVTNRQWSMTCRLFCLSSLWVHWKNLSMGWDWSFGHMRYGESLWEPKYRNSRSCDYQVSAGRTIVRCSIASSNSRSHQFIGLFNSSRRTNSYATSWITLTISFIIFDSVFLVTLFSWEFIDALLAMLQVWSWESFTGWEFRHKMTSTFLLLKRLWMAWQERPVPVHFWWISFQFVGATYPTSPNWLLMQWDISRTPIDPDKSYVLILRYRAWMPGAGFQVKARYWRKAVMEMRDGPFEFVLKAVVGSLTTVASSRSLLFDPLRRLEQRIPVS